MSQARTAPRVPAQTGNNSTLWPFVKSGVAFVGRVLFYAVILTLSFWVLEAHINEAFLYEGF